MSNELNEKLAKILSSSDLVWDEDYLTIRVSADFALEHLQVAFKEFGYLRPFDLDANEVSISTVASSWEHPKQLTFHKTKESFWSTYAEFNHASYFYLTDCKSTNLAPECRFSEALECYEVWKLLLKELADHEGSKDSIELYIYFVGHEKGARKREIAKFPTLTSILEHATKEAKATAEKLLAILQLKDEQAYERKEIMRVALIDCLDDSNADTKNYFSKLLESHESLSSKYHESFSTYMHRSSINDLIEEVSEKNIDYANKLNDSVASLQLKAFAMPGALIAIGALIKGVGLVEISLICFGLWIIQQYTISANKIHRSILVNLSEQVSLSFAKYNKPKIDTIVKQQAQESTIKLQKLIERAKSRIKTIDNFTRLMFYAGLIYLILTFTIPFVLNMYNSMPVNIIVRAAIA